MINVPGYRADEQLYESRQSRIYRGHRLLDGVPVVFKLMNDELPSPEKRARFRQEFHLMRKLQSDGIASAYSLESHQGIQVMIVEDFGGTSLDKLPIAAAMPLGEWLALAIRITGCLEKLHQQRIMHKDINPSNIVWNRQTGQVKLIDLGISTELTREIPEIRNPNYLEGTLPYLSPEQTGRMNRALDYRTDFYSLGVTFYELLTGQLPFVGDDALELVHAHIAKQPVPAHQIDPRIPAVLSAIIGKLMEKTAEARYQSAAGLKADLQWCLDTLDAKNNIQEFALGRSDFSGRLQIPQKLYGRDTQTATLMQAFERASNGPAELLLVSGYSGIGKSALVHEVQKPITQRRGYFIEGKFDQFKKDIPYAALTQAFEELIRHLLTEGDAEIRRWKERLLQALGSNAQVIIQVIPNVELIVGAQPAVVELPPEQAHNRFNQEFRKFVSVFASMEHPLVVFLDDLQWADLPTLQVMSLLLRSPATPHLLLIGAYRDNEITPVHPLPLILQEMEKNGAAIQTITLPSLQLEEVKRLLSDALHVNSDGVESLAQICLSKTQGNPFFLSQFLGLLVDRQMLRGDVLMGCWQWDIAAIQHADITDNIVELLVAKLQRLSAATRQVLQGAACLGNQFDLRTLAIVCAMAEADAASLLWDALAEELIVPLDDYYKYVRQSDNEVERDLVPAYRFQHDRVQQAAYSLGSADDKTAIHLTIGRLWLKSLSAAEQQGRLFDLVNHFNLGRALITDDTEREHVARLNLDAARRAKTSAAYKPALAYLQTAMELMSDPAWQRNYELQLPLHLDAAEAAYFSADFALMERYLAVVLQRARDVLDLAKAYEIRIQAYISEDRFHDAVMQGLEILHQLGMPFPKQATRLHIVTNLIKTRMALSRREIESLAQLPDMTDPHILAASNILLKVIMAAYYGMPTHFFLFLCKTIRLTLRFGHSPVSSMNFAGYGMVLSGALGDVEQGAKFSDLALQLRKRSTAVVSKIRTMLMVYSSLEAWTKPLHTTLDPLRQIHLDSMAAGDLETAANAATLYCIYALFCGHELTQLEKETAAYCGAIELLQRPSIFKNQKILWQFQQNLIGKSQDPAILQGEICDERQLQEIELMADDHFLTSTLFFFRCLSLYFFRRYREALAAIEVNGKYVDRLVGNYGASQHYFYDSLVRLEVLGDASFAERVGHLRKIRKNQKKMQHWAKHNPQNFLNKWILVKARLAQHAGKPLKAMRHYEQAIRLAKDNGFLQEEALAKELAGEFHLHLGQDALAQFYLREAQQSYHRWGALAKVADLVKRYPQWLHEPSAAQAIATLANPTMSTTNSEISSSGILDFATAMKASQALSQEIVLERLLKRLLQVVIESAGAQRGMLLLKKDDRWFLEAEQGDGDTAATVLQSICLDESSRDEIPLPLSLVHYVERTRESIVVHEATQEKLLANDPYVQRHALRSLLCLPILNHREMTGMLYLENNAVSGAFTVNRLEVLQLLASQAAISIENARLYADMEGRVTARTAELKVMSQRDGLTGVANRKAFDERMQEEFSRVQRSGQSLSLLIIDIDHFKQVNDSYGHLVGDECLRRMGKVLAGVSRRASDFVARYGGEEFVFILPDTDLSGAVLFAERALCAVRSIDLEVDRIHHPITASIGVATASGNSNTDIAGLVAKADRCLYAAKRAGRNCIVHVDPMSHPSAEMFSTG
ncbi:diguanylate cyclase [Noviherbaspirillum sp.]|uniref:diguanylate cyclase n=1 Tax=Noviherbaspirillum sp. TaxID=1926288 RepID=UPI002B49E0BE|nr:diguanylate cyclase [Noviherbaspirillum sp.]